jgi:hypothetical protein
LELGAWSWFSEPLPGKPDLRERRGDHELASLSEQGDAPLADPLVGLVSPPSLRSKVAREHPSGHLRIGEGAKRAPEIAPFVAVLQPAGDEIVEGRPRDDADLAGASNRARQRSEADARPHASLDDDRFHNSSVIRTARSYTQNAYA